MKVKIEGMSCMHCVKNVERVIKEVTGVSSVIVNLEMKEAIIEGNANPKEIEKAIEDVGFEVKGIE